MNGERNEEIESIPSFGEKEVEEERRRELIKIWKETGNHKKEQFDSPSVE